MKWITTVLAIAGLAFSGWKAFEALEAKSAQKEAVNLIAPIVAYRDIYESGRSREANDLLLRAVALLIKAENEGGDPREILRVAERINNTPVNYSDLLTDSMLRNIKIARELKLDTPANLELMSEGKSPIVGSGPYTGEKIEVDHIVPRSLAPDLDNLLINLEMMPMTLNRRKSNKVTERAAAMAKRFYEAGVMTPDSFERVMKAKS
ncbi:hypothetical protein N9B73_06045 [Verrucomicrobiales bacterium]|nr:hypothetical protein [Verrucomicrobiales bacterium]